MQVFMFTSMRDPAVFGFINNRKGVGLPTALAPWHALGRRALSGSVGSESSDAVRAAIGTDGCFLARSDGGAFAGPDLGRAS